MKEKKVLINLLDILTLIKEETRSDFVVFGIVDNSESKFLVRVRCAKKILDKVVGIERTFTVEEIEKSVDSGASKWEIFSRDVTAHWIMERERIYREKGDEQAKEF